MPVPASVSFMLLGTVRGRNLLPLFSNQFLSSGNKYILGDDWWNCIPPCHHNSHILMLYSELGCGLCRFYLFFDDWKRLSECVFWRISSGTVHCASIISTSFLSLPSHIALFLPFFVPFFMPFIFACLFVRLFFSQAHTILGY